MVKERRFVCLESVMSVVPHNHPAYTSLQQLPFVTESEIMRHGQWKRTPTSNMLYCSVCDKIPESQIETPHCPECGAKLTPSEVPNG